MWKALIIGAALVIGGKMGFDYILSEDFQSYADKNKLQWSCYLNNLMGNLHLVMSDYKQAHDLFERSLKRCPDSSCAEEASFKVAESLDSGGNRPGALRAYENFLEKYKSSPRARTAQRAVDVLKHGL